MAAWSALLGVVLAAVFVAIAVVRAERSGNPGGAVVLPPGSSLSTGAAVPVKFSLARLGRGERVEVASVVGRRPAVVNFFASWCPDCVAELAGLARSWRTKGAAVNFLGIDTNDSNPGLAQSQLSRAGAGYPVGVDDSSDTMTRAWGLANGLPVTFFLDRKGRIALEVLGKESSAILARRVAELAAGRPLS